MLSYMLLIRRSRREAKVKTYLCAIKSKVEERLSVHLPSKSTRSSFYTTMFHAFDFVQMLVNVIEIV